MRSTHRCRLGRMTSTRLEPDADRICTAGVVAMLTARHVALSPPERALRLGESGHGISGNANAKFVDFFQNFWGIHSSSLRRGEHSWRASDFRFAACIELAVLRAAPAGLPSMTGKE